MAERLTDLYKPGDRVEILLEAGSRDAYWQTGTVLARDFPGVWVDTAAGGRWFVTNGRRIRPADADPPSGRAGR